MEKLKSLLENNPKRLAALLMVHHDLQSDLLRALQNESMNKTVIDFLKSKVCPVKVLEILLENSSNLIICGLREPNPNFFDMYLMYTIAYAAGLIEAIRQYKL